LQGKIFPQMSQFRAKDGVGPGHIGGFGVRGEPGGSAVGVPFGGYHVHMEVHEGGVGSDGFSVPEKLMPTEHPGVDQSQYIHRETRQPRVGVNKGLEGFTDAGLRDLSFAGVDLRPVLNDVEDVVQFLLRRGVIIPSLEIDSRQTDSQIVDQIVHVLIGRRPLELPFGVDLVFQDR